VVNDIKVRPAIEEDIDVIVENNRAMAEETEGKTLDVKRLREGVREVFRSGGEKGFYLVAETAGCVAGQLLITREWSDWRNGTFWWIQSVYVRPQWRGKGVFRAMYEYVHRIVESRDDLCGIRLYVARSNLTAQKVYRALGMSETGYYVYETDLVLG